MQKLIVAFTGKMGSGKDTACDYLVEQYGFTKLAFADPLVKMARAIDPIIDEYGTRLSDVFDELGYNAAKRQYPELRKFLQLLGTEAVRNVLGENTWCDYTFNIIENSPASRFAISGTRFLNEAAYVHAHSGFIVRVDRTDSSSTDQHISETELDEIELDYHVSNQFRKKEILYEQLDELMWHLTRLKH